MRLFISIELTEDIRAEISGLIEAMRKKGSGVKWVEPRNLHVTLKFLGHVPDEKIEKIIGAASEALGNSEPFRTSFRGAGSFPGGKRPRVFWVGARKGSEKQAGLARLVDSAMAAAGFDEEKREFTPHVTIGRVKDPKEAGSLLRALEEAREKSFGEMTVDRVSLMKSTLSRKGPTYETVREFYLKAK